MLNGWLVILTGAYFGSQAYIMSILKNCARAYFTSRLIFFFREIQKSFVPSFLLNNNSRISLRMFYVCLIFIIVQTSGK